MRPLFRLRDRTKESYKQDIRRLREHFARFNADVAGLCQWLMRLRPNHAKSIPGGEALWDFFLEPAKPAAAGDEGDAERYRLQAFEAAAFAQPPPGFADPPFTAELRESLRAVAQAKPTRAAQELFARLKGYSHSHRAILIKAGAEWIASRYARAYQNWSRHREEWQKEKDEWEQRHPQLTVGIRDQLNRVFRELQVRDKRARICSAERLQQNNDNCEFAGEGYPHRHAPLCVKYNRFLKAQKDSDKWKRFFRENAERVLRGEKPRAGKWFHRVWPAYLKELGLSQKNLQTNHHCHLPHCGKLGSECAYNPHKGYFQADFPTSEIGLRLDAMPPGEFLKFRFGPWPCDYHPQPHEAAISSVHLHFVGTRPRLGFRFSVSHKPSRFACSQDEIDELRSRTYPRAAQDGFLEAARSRLLALLPAGAPDELRILAVDLGTAAAHAALFVGKRFAGAQALPVVKLEKLYSALPQEQSAPESGRAKGLSLGHV
ncbi:MAG: hypothetical protein ACRD6I_17415, partial [Candidatus Acidiferrales bacterium]